MDSIDRLLAQVKSEYETLPNQQLNIQPPQVKEFKQSASKPISEIDSLLTELKDDYEQKDRVEEQLKQQQIKAEELRQKQLQQQQLEELTSCAKAWLKKLDPLSTEGLWFENFAVKYQSKLAAAVDYLKSD